MADAITTTYSLTKPEVGASADSWGAKLNANFDKVDDLLDGSSAIKPNLTAGQWKVSGVTVTSTAAELNVLDGITASTSELNIMDGVTATAAEINKLDGLTASTAELNKLSGLAASTAELNYVDGVTSSIQSQINSLSSTASSLQSQISGNDSDISSLSSQISSNDTDISTLSGRITSNDSDISSLQSSVTSINGTTSSLQSQISGNDSDISSLQSQVNGKLAKASNLSDLTSASSARTNLGLVPGVNVQSYDADIPTVAASQAEMEAGTQSGIRSMSPLRIAQAIAALTPTATISKAATGYWIDASGLIVQWGNNTGFSSTVRTVTFPIAFPTLCAAIAGAPRDVSSSSTRTEIITAKSNTSFSYKSEANHDGYYWIALGY